MPVKNPVGTDYLLSPQMVGLNEVPLNCLYHAGERLGEWQKCVDAYQHIKDDSKRGMSAHLLDEAGYRLQRCMIGTVAST